jgi:hypothetical protein
MIVAASKSKNGCASSRRRTDVPPAGAAAAAQHIFNIISPPAERSFPKKEEAIMEVLVHTIAGLAIQYWMLWATTIVIVFVAWEIWSSMRHH